MTIHLVARPGMLDLKGKAKWDAYTKKKGLSTDDAKAAYVEAVEVMVGKYNK